MSVQTTGLSKEERGGRTRNVTLLANKPPIGGEFDRFDCVRSIPETAKILGLSIVAFRVMLARGDGPKVTRLGTRRIGIRDSARNAWLDAQTAEYVPA
jgi:predicted DNA-binding transcriptional regulator AlpA